MLIAEPMPTLHEVARNAITTYLLPKSTDPSFRKKSPGAPADTIAVVDAPPTV